MLSIAALPVTSSSAEVPVMVPEPVTFAVGVIDAHSIGLRSLAPMVRVSFFTILVLATVLADVCAVDATVSTRTRITSGPLTASAVHCADTRRTRNGRSTGRASRRESSRGAALGSVGVTSMARIR